MIGQWHFLPDSPLAGKHPFDQPRCQPACGQAPALGIRRGGDQNGGVEGCLRAGFKEQGDIGEKVASVFSACATQLLPAGAHNGVNDLLQTAALLGRGEDDLPQGCAIQGGGCWQLERLTDGSDDSGIGREQLMHASVRVENGEGHPIRQEASESGFAGGKTTCESKQHDGKAKNWSGGRPATDRQPTPHTGRRTVYFCRKPLAVMLGLRRSSGKPSGSTISSWSRSSSGRRG